MGVWSGATNDYDPGFDRPLEILGLGAAAVYHETGEQGWTGPTDYYITDYRAPLGADGSQTWSPLYLWANPEAYTDETMFLSIEPAADAVPPSNRHYSLELLYVPDGVTGAPPVGTVWDVQPDHALVVEVPTYKSDDGRTGYQFAFTVGAVPEPAPVLAVAAALLAAGRRATRAGGR
jgi:hypothetical protein